CPRARGHPRNRADHPRPRANAVGDARHPDHLRHARAGPGEHEGGRGRRHRGPRASTAGGGGAGPRARAAARQRERHGPGAGPHHAARRGARPAAGQQSGRGHQDHVRRLRTGHPRGAQTGPGARPRPRGPQVDARDRRRAGDPGGAARALPVVQGGPQDRRPQDRGTRARDHPAGGHARRRPPGRGGRGRDRRAEPHDPSGLRQGCRDQRATARSGAEPAGARLTGRPHAAGPCRPQEGARRLGLDLRRRRLPVRAGPAGDLPAGRRAGALTLAADARCARSRKGPLPRTLPSGRREPGADLAWHALSPAGTARLRSASDPPSIRVGSIRFRRSVGGMSGIAARVGEVYRQTRKPKDILWNRFVARPLAAVLLVPLRATRVTPNQVTLVTLLVFAGGAAMLALWPGWRALLIAAGVLELSYVLDCVDGQLARLKGTSSPVGAHLDFLMDELKAFLLVAAVGIRLWRPEHDPRFLIEGVAGVAVLAGAISLTTFVRRPEYAAATGQAVAHGAGDYGEG